ncbi:bifunctional UDP-N-acetylmuramate--L-alanine ligase/D-alanine--D-alanine ligase [Chlamydia gallinacea]|uniref:bifunctional UDP-N-acetylmuramate--L-alanine ligase/D-alanine--D-alanine ligase n=1 Tax=Chlamydia gallinacea TaxID=1457153 RepID=UPI0023F19E9E|nr:bifunctional UDP-N-acetylmuramate--L-alanine ligase/D-alanine--D-alanine ligase [Chlamydia gallinacea]
MNTVHYHFIGIGGIGMSALAHILLDRGHCVSGSDVRTSVIIDTLRSKGATCFLGHDKNHVPKKGYVVYSSGIADDNVEYQEAKSLRIPLIHRSVLLAQLMENHTSILISGSHGKTTVSSLITAILKTANQDPSYAIGGLNAESLNGYAGHTKYFIAEADESDGSLRNYSPSAVVITNVDNEHLNNFENDRRKLVDSLEEFARKVPDPRYCFYSSDCSELRARIQGVSYGFSEKDDLYISSFSQQGWQSVFSIKFLGKEYHDIRVWLVGKHNVANAAVAMGMALTLGIDEGHIRAGLKNFSGIQRRLERKNHSEKFLFLEDYAHHPREIMCTLRGVRDAIGSRRILAICQPHRFSRLYACLEDFYVAFRDADEVILTDVYSAGETPVTLPDIEKIASMISKLSHVQCYYIPYDHIVSYLKQNICVHDVCLALGAGNIDAIGNALQDFEPKKLSVGIICGGQSYEHDISLLSAKNVASYFSSEHYDVSYFIINRQGLWKKVDHLHDVLYSGQGVFSSILSEEIASALNDTEFVFPILHGPFGEDGTLQGFVEMLGKPYGGPSLLCASIGMDKVMTKLIASSVGVPVVPYQTLTLRAWKRSPELCLQNLLTTFTFPMFVKTVHLGSSLGIFEVHNEQELHEKISEAFLYDTDVFVEESRLGSREIEISCIGDASTCYYMTEPHERGSRQFIDYETKYGLNNRDRAQINYHPDLSLEEKTTVKELAKKVYRVLRGQGSCRIDFFLDHEGNFWLSEVNPIPGMTKDSPFLHGFLHLGWTPEQVIHEIIISGLYKFRCKRSVSMNNEPNQRSTIKKLKTP